MASQADRPPEYAHESVDHSRADYATWLDLLQERGNSTVAIGGHSGGAVRAVYAQARKQYPQVAGVIAMSPGEYDHDGLIDLHGDEFNDAYSWCLDQLSAGNPDGYTSLWGCRGAMCTAAAFVDSYNVDNRYSVTRGAGELTCPALFVFGSEECGDGPNRLPVCGAAMHRLRRADYPHVTVEAINGANHMYVGRDFRLFEIVLRWLSRL